MRKSRNNGRILSLLLILAMLLPCIGMSASSADIPCAEPNCGGKYSNGICSADAAHFEAPALENGVYGIGSAGQLFRFAALVNSGVNEYTGDNGDVYNAVLTADITIPDGLAWIPMGLYTGAGEYIRYSGTFDGAGHTISGLTYNNTTYTGRIAAFIGCLDSNGTVRDLTLADARISGATDIAGIAAHNYGTVTGCTVSGTVSGTGTTGGIVSRNMDGGKVENCVNTATVSGAVTGGIAGENAADADISGCRNSGTVSGTNSVGGIVGINSGTVEDARNTGAVTGANTHVGGIAGNHVGGAITRCGNSGNVTGASDYIGGVAGVCSGAALTGSFNTGSVTGTGNSEAVGGVAGAIDGTNLTPGIITACCNTGSVTGRSWVGGIAGISGYQKTPQPVQISGSYNTGTVTGTSYTGAVIGAMNKGTVSGCYYLAGCGANTLSGAAEAAAERFASGEIAYTLNGSTDTGTLVWYQNLDIPGTPADAAPLPDPSRGIVHAGYRNCTQTGYTNREAYDVPGDHVDADDDCVCDLCGTCVNGAAVNAQTGRIYATVTEALTAARQGDTIRLLDDTQAGYVLVYPGTTLDLNGHELTAEYLVCFDTARAVDDAGGGRLRAGKDCVILDESNSMIPVWDGSGYLFTKVGFAIAQDTAYSGGIKVDAVAYPQRMDVVDLLKDGCADNHLQVMIVLTWDNDQGSGSQRFVFNDAVVASVYSSNQGGLGSYGKMFSMVINGVDGIENLKASIVLLSGTNTEYGIPAIALN